MWEDPIVLEIRKNREKHAASFNFDIEKIINDARERQKNSAHKIVPVKKKKIAVAS